MTASPDSRSGKVFPCRPLPQSWNGIERRDYFDLNPPKYDRGGEIGITPTSLPRTGRATLMASGSTGQHVNREVKPEPLDQLVKLVLPGHAAHLDDRRNRVLRPMTITADPAARPKLACACPVNLHFRAWHRNFFQDLPEQGAELFRGIFRRIFGSHLASPTSLFFLKISQPLPRPFLIVLRDYLP